MMRQRTYGMKAFAVLVAAVLALTGTGVAVISADHGKDDRGSHNDDHDRAFGAWLYEGTCDSLASTPLRDIGDLEQESDADDLADLALPTPVPSAVWMEDEDVDLTVSDLTATPHAVVVRANEDVSSEVIACGEVANAPVGDAPFSFPLRAVGDSGYTGKVIVSNRIDTHEADLIVGIWEGSSPATPAA